MCVCDAKYLEELNFTSCTERKKEIKRQNLLVLYTEKKRIYTEQHKQRMKNKKRREGKRKVQVHEDEQEVKKKYEGRKKKNKF